MDTNKILPQLFFDVISRIIPGVLAMVLVSSALGRDLGSLVTGPFAGAPSLRASPLFLSLAIVGGAYIIGQLIAPLSDLYERRIIGTLVPRGYWVFPAAVGPASPYPPAMRRFIAQELALEEGGAAASSERYGALLFVWYDWLRVWQPEAGARVEKIRAEYRMFGGVAVAALLALCLHGLRSLLGPGGVLPLFIAGDASMFVFASWGLARTYRTFQRSVLNQYYVAREAERLGRQDAPKEGELVRR